MKPHMKLAHQAKRAFQRQLPFSNLHPSHQPVYKPPPIKPNNLHPHHTMIFPVSTILMNMSIILHTLHFPSSFRFASYLPFPIFAFLLSLSFDVVYFKAIFERVAMHSLRNISA
jgi:hypothetical protein